MGDVMGLFANRSRAPVAAMDAAAAAAIEEAAAAAQDLLLLLHKRVRVLTGDVLFIRVLETV